MSASRLTCAVLLAIPAAIASATSPGDLQFHGFATQGYVLSAGNNLNGSSADGDGSARFQELGLNASWRPHADVLLAGQVAAVRHGRAVDEYLLLEYGLVDYTPVQGERGRWGLRAGKLKLPIGFYNDSRDAVFARPGILMPQGVYLETSGGRAFGYFSEYGLATYGDVYLGNHAVYAELGLFGQQDLGDTADIAILRKEASGEFEVEHGVQLRISDDYDGGRLRAAISLASVEVSYSADPATTSAFNQPGDLDFDQAVASLQYNWPRFSLTAEYVWRKFKLEDLVGTPLLSSAVDLSPSGAYLQGTWRVTPALSAFLRYDEQIRDDNDRHGRRQEAESRAASQRAAAFGVNVPVQPRHYYFAKEWVTGARYDLTRNVTLLGEFHYVDGVAWVNPLDNPEFDRGDADRYWNFVALMLAYRF